MPPESGPAQEPSFPGPAVITGASSGIGLAAAVALARRGVDVALVGRHAARLTDAAAEVREASGTTPATFRADFAVLDEVRALAERLLAGYDRIGVLANNAGAIMLRPVTTVDGFESTMQANHLAPFLLTRLLLDRIERVVTTASGAHRSGALDPTDLNAALGAGGRYRAMRAYGTSKQANILFAAELARRRPDIVSVSFHPGVVRTRFANEHPVVAWGMRIAPLLRTPAQGAQTLVWLAGERRSRLVDGGYYVDGKLRRPRSWAADPQLAAALWTASERAVGLPEAG
ncbi:SDR family NAD(P)-dependent oxidoreductase [Micromonospora sp. NBC_01813]|uniref:SDR family NAD(P)-dependent oxidoreductase n=1 Tax=Micromonospora sp. NBC_01813 TaxID=2975988 RepID=UPI002DDA2F52|nr:SDR family NAD(P)-dependent oxidoreductase [Micromonospora sp. NBC_01813]WSA06426.1 SDR family NAD(P)-dependent oxidoreductase [Micromonospora sp. NBC_01813]